MIMLYDQWCTHDPQIFTKGKSQNVFVFETNVKLDAFK